MTCAYNTRNGAHSLYQEALAQSRFLETCITIVMLHVFLLFGLLLCLIVLLSQRNCHQNWILSTNNYIPNLDCFFLDFNSMLFFDLEIPLFVSLNI